MNPASSELRETVLENGAAVVTCGMRGMNSVSAGIWLRAGSRYEKEDNNGISHFMEHLVFKGSSNRSGREIRRQIEGAGGSLNGFTSQESTCYLAKVAGGRFAKGLAVLLDMVLNPVLKQPDIEKERGVIREEIGRIYDLPMHYVHVLFDKLVWGKHPLGFSICGTVPSVTRIGRDGLLAYKNNFHGPGNMIVVCAGNVEHERAVDEAARLLPAGDAGGRLLPLPVKSRQRKRRILVQERDTEQSHLCMGFRTFPYSHRDRYVLSVLNVILGGNMSSRLFEEIREKRGLAYHISSSVHWLSDTGNFLVSAGVAPARSAEAVAIILSQLRRLSRKNVFKRELQRAKEFLTGQFMLTMEGTSDVMLWTGENKILTGSVPGYPGVLEGIRRVSEEDVKRVAGAVFREEGLNVALVGPNKAREIENVF